jgi:hypothetical protein
MRSIEAFGGDSQLVAESIAGEGRCRDRLMKGMSLLLEGKPEAQELLFAKLRAKEGYANGKTV